MELEEKIEVLKKCNNDDTRFLVNVCNAYKKNNIEIEKLKEKFLKENHNFQNAKNIKELFNGKSDFNNINYYIDLDELYAGKFLNTKMNFRLNNIIKNLEKADLEDVKKYPKKIAKKCINDKGVYTVDNNEKLIKVINELIKLAEEFDSDNIKILKDRICFKSIENDRIEEKAFIEYNLKKVLEAVCIVDRKKQYEYIYNEIGKILQERFIDNCFCDFIKGSCLSQRHRFAYPVTKKNGCCFTYVRRCPNLNKEHKCEIDCMACKLFSCKYLTDRGIGFYTSEFVLMQFFNSKQRHILVYDFFKPKKNIIEKLLKNIEKD